MREPWFWRSQSLTARAITSLLSPASVLYQLGQSLRWKFTKPFQSNVPVICIGNATLGGTGKTPFAIMVSDLLRAADKKSFFLTRGYGGALYGPVLVDQNNHSAKDVGDEALLLARHAPTIVAKDRPAGARLAAAEGADAIIMDDGFQNPTLEKNLSILLVAFDHNTQNQRVFPAGPNREYISNAKARADIVVLVGPDERIKGNADYHAWLEPSSKPENMRAIAFAGLGRPERFFGLLKTCGAEVVQEYAFPDHHPYAVSEIEMLTRAAKRENATLITTEKDFVRIPADLQKGISVFPVKMQTNNPDALRQLLADCIAAHPKLGDNVRHG